jgi:multicomponent Na+:H+ antiporter subunit D
VSLLLVLPVLVPLATAALCLMVRRSPRAQRVLAVLGAAALLLASVLLLLEVRAEGVLAVQVGGWPAPFGITFVADLLAAIMTVLAGLVGLAVAVYSGPTVDDGRVRHGYYPLFHVLLMGVCGAFLTGDLFNLYVWFEVMLIASFVLLALGGERPQLEGAVKYVILNLLSSALFLSGVGILYGQVGTLNMADLSVKLAGAETGLITTVAALFMVAFGIKAAVFPLFFWLPASYHTPPLPVSAIFAGLLTKVGVYALLRMFTLVFVGDTAFTHGILLGVAALTMLSGVLGAAAHSEFRRILSFHIVSQIGYMVMGLALYTKLAVAGAIFYVAHHIVVKTNLFLVAGLVHRLRGTYELERLGGLYVARPLLAVLFLVPALSLAGIPPLSGFFAKLSLVQAALEAETYWIVAVALAVGLLTLYSMTKIWAEVFWKDDPGPAPGGVAPPPPVGGRLATRGPVVVLAAVTVAIGLGAEHLLELSKDAAEQLLSREEYLSAVLGRERP